jgi:hypothetical protein
MFQSIVHGLIGGSLSVATHALKTVAGPQPPSSYTTDADGKMTPVYNSPDRSRDRIGRIAAAALQGLAAGAQVHRPGANALAGVGAGFQAEQQSAQQQDLLKRQQSKEAFEQEQQATTAKYIRAQHNISTHSLWQKGLEDENEHDPERLKTAAIKGAAEDYIARNPSTSMTQQVLSESEGRALMAADKSNPASTTHAFFPYGMREVKENGQTVYENDGVTPKKEGQVLVIGGGSKDGKLPLPQTYVDDLKKYGKLAGIQGLDNVKAGDEWALDKFLRANAMMNPVKGQEIDGWKEKTFGENAVKVGNQWMQQNSFTGERKPYAGVPAGVDLKDAQAFKDRAEGAKFLAEKNGSTEEIAGQGIDLVEGDLVPSQLAKRSKSYNSVLKAANDYSMSKYGKRFDFEKAERDYKFASNIGTQNTLKYLNSLTGNPKDGANGILDQLVSVSDGISRSKFPALTDIDAWEKLQAGDPKYIPLFNLATDAADQFAKIMSGGGSGNATSDAKINQGLKMFRTGFSKDQMRASASSTKSMLSTRKRELIGDNRYLLKDYGDPAQRTTSAPAPSQQRPTQAQSTPPNAPPINLLEEGIHTSFKNGSVWTLQNGQPVQIQSATSQVNQ